MNGDSKLIGVSIRITKNQEEELKRFQKIIGFDSYYKFVDIGVDLSIQLLQKIFRACKNNNETFRETFLNPNGINPFNASRYIPFFELTDCLQPIQKQKFFTYLEETKLKGGYNE